ncbi:hypothetical protein [Methylobacterium aerolatum]|uniref:Uncharacterized protein n=1 Tax=Methylobacterium aerolatum TaxID=418708 RepID=A0ABU0HZ21_9HYPH|nr:hypothetical protein [Methylobacterium aerolatum]MDQ0446729.1 hypothetical protein [Methylobacterium aerolatum]GJD33696.1 hypothetical protein FMGBMHLM_0589 [Methylobacterium aerolatum]
MAGSRGGDAFLDVIGAGPVAASASATAGRSGSGGGAWAVAVAPLAAALTALGIVALTGLSRRSGVPDILEPYAYGYFLDRYPLFAFALVYGAARIVAVAAGPGPGGPVRRGVFAAAGLAVLAGAGLYPTFGGLILRGGYATGGMAFLTGQPLWLAYALGAGVAASMVGGIVGASGLAANGVLRPRLRRIGGGALSFALLWFAAGVIGLAHAAGTGPWPARPITGSEAGLAAGLLAAAALPHAVFQAWRGWGAR